ncbi:MAG TPA: hypothetical protein VJG90_03460 [Candidatus Nanoarchaeia archaeon]|nr:hypothetical protein [Candidatus Nanoarchaeia archaeon]
MKMQDLIDAAKRQKWEFVDTHLAEVCNDSSNIEWAVGVGLDDLDGNVRDLAASLLERADIQPSAFEQMRSRLHSVMTRDSHPYARYRSALALAAHGPGSYREEVMRVLGEASTDPDVSDLAKAYLSKL